MVRQMSAEFFGMFWLVFGGAARLCWPLLFPNWGSALRAFCLLSA